MSTARPSAWSTTYSAVSGSGRGERRDAVACGMRELRSRRRRGSPTTRSRRRTRSSSGWGLRCPGSVAPRPSLQSELEHRRLLSALAKGEFEDVLAAIALAEQRTADLGRPGSPRGIGSSAGGSRSSGETTRPRASCWRRGPARPRCTRRSARCLPESRSGSWTCWPRRASPPRSTARSRRSTSWTRIWSRATPPPCWATRRTPSARPTARWRSAVSTGRGSGWRRLCGDARASSRPDRPSRCSRRRSSWRSRRHASRVTVRVLASYGAALRRSGRVTEAREALLPSHRHGRRHGHGAADSERVRGARAGGRTSAPRTRTSGPQSLTAASNRWRRWRRTARRTDRSPKALRHHQDGRNPPRSRLPQARHRHA